jgi:hypothetical protein
LGNAAPVLKKAPLVVLEVNAPAAMVDVLHKDRRNKSASAADASRDSRTICCCGSPTDDEAAKGLLRNKSKLEVRAFVAGEVANLDALVSSPPAAAPIIRPMVCPDRSNDAASCKNPAGRGGKGGKTTLLLLLPLLLSVLRPLRGGIKCAKESSLGVLLHKAGGVGGARNGDAENDPGEDDRVRPKLPCRDTDVLAVVAVLVGCDCDG